MTHEEFFFFSTKYQDILLGFLKNADYEVFENDIPVLIKIYYTGPLSVKTNRIDNTHLYRLYRRGLLFRIQQTPSFLECSLSTNGIIFLNKLFKCINDAFFEFEKENKIDYKFLKQNFILKTDKNKKLLFDIKCKK